MKRTFVWAIFLLAPLLIASAGSDATLSWELPTQFADGTPISPSEGRKIVVEVYSGPTKDGPWRCVVIASPGATSAIVPGPSGGHTLWYTVKSTLHGVESGYAAPVRKTNYSIPLISILKNIVKKTWKMKGELLLVSLIFLFFLAGWLMYRQKKGKK